MSTSLRPPFGTPHLSVPAVLDRLRSAFPFLHIDEREGLRFVSERIARLSPLPPHEEIDRILASLSDAVEVIVADHGRSDRLFLRTIVVPNEPVVVEWNSPNQRRNCRHLLGRYAEALGYEVVDDVTP